MRLRYEFTGHLDPVVRKLLGNRKLTWIQDLHFDLAMLRGRLTFAAEADANPHCITAARRGHSAECNSRADPAFESSPKQLCA